METSSPYRPRVSRETRLLLTAGVMAVAALWLLARIRFPERPVTPNPVPSVLSQLASGPKYDDLAGEIAQLQARLQPSLLALDVPSAVGSLQTSHTDGGHQTARRPGRDVGPAWLEPEPGGTMRPSSPAMRLPASQSSVCRSGHPPLLRCRGRHASRSNHATSWPVTSHRRACRCARHLWVRSIPIDSPLWSEPLWAVPEHTDLAAGSFLFTNDAELAGLVITYRRGLAIVPGGTVLAEAERLLAAPPGPPGTIGIEVQDLTPPVASVTAASVGVVVAWVDRNGARSEQLMVGDVIEAVDGRALATRQQWDVRDGSSLSGRDTQPSRAPPRRNPRGGVGRERPRGAARESVAWSHLTRADEDWC